MRTNGASPPVLGWRRAVVGAAVALLVGAGVVALIGRVAGWGALEDVIARSHPAWLAVSALGQVAVFAGIALAFREAVRFERGPRLGARLALRVTVTAFGASQLVAAAGAASLALGYWALRRVGFPPREAAVRLVGFQTCVYLVFGLVGWTAALVALARGRAPLGLTLPWVVAIPLALLAARWFTAPSRVRRWTAGGGGWLRRGLGVGVGAAWWTRRAAAGRHALLFLGATAYWAGDVASLWGALRATGAEPPLPALVLAYATGYVASAVPVPLVATGGVDAATTGALHAVGVPLEQALLGVVAHRVFAFWLPLLPALVLAVRLPRTSRDLGALAGP